jgi:hypothetical protein
MSAQTQQVNSVFDYIYRDLTHRLGGIRKENDAMFLCDCGNFLYRLNGARFIICIHHR